MTTTATDRTAGTPVPAGSSATVPGAPVPRVPSGGFRRLLLATDLSPASEAAVVRALDLAHDLAADLIAVSVIDPRALRLPGGRSAARVDQVRTSREVMAQELVARGRERGVRVTFMIWEGEPGEAIVDAARAEQVDLVIVGSRGIGRAGRALIGSVSDHVVRHAPCPVLVARADTVASAG